jgi:hypothetical protein
VKPHLLDPRGGLDPDLATSPWAQDLVSDLGLDVVLDSMADDDPLIRAVALSVLVAPSPSDATTRYRQEILVDVLAAPAAARELYAAAGALLTEARHVHGSFLRGPGPTLRRARTILTIALPVLRRMRDLASAHRAQWRSTGLRDLAGVLESELDEDFFAEAEDHLRFLAFPRGAVTRIGLGPGLRGEGFVLVRPRPDTRGWVSRLVDPHPGELTYRLAERDEAGARALSELRDRALAAVADAVGQASEHVLDFCRALRTELAFYLGCVNLADRLAQGGVPMCVPLVGSADVAIRAQDLRDVALTLAGEPVVGNDVDADDAQLIVVTGANRGGKSTFLRSLGQAQVMAQAGMLVAAVHLRLPAARHTVTHFRREEDAELRSGKLEEELSRMSALVDHLAPGDLVLANESFASTNEREGSEIARQVFEPLLGVGVRVALVTHLTDLAIGWSVSPPAPALFLRADPASTADRPFRLRPGLPLDTSHGVELADRLLPAVE